MARVDAVNGENLLALLRETISASVAAALSGGMAERARIHLADTIAAITLGRDESGIALPSAVDGDLLVRFAAAVRASEIDDFHPRACVTPGSVVVPVALVIGADEGADAEAILAAIVAGYEAMIAFGVATGGAAIVHNARWPTGLAAPIVAAAVAGRLMGLDAAAIEQAMALAAGRASAAYPHGGDPVGRLLLFGSSVAEGVRCARFARAGLHGDRERFALFLERCTGLPLAPVEPRGRAMPQVEIKPHCTSRQALSATEAARRCAAGKDVSAIDRIRVWVPAQHRAMVDRPDPAGGGAVASVQCQIACALLRPEALFARRRDAELADPAVRAMMDRVEVTGDDALGALYPDIWSAKVEVCLGAERVSCRVDEPVAPEAASWDEIWPKLVRLMPGDAAARLIAAAQGFGKAEGCTAVELLDIAATLLHRVG